MVCQNCLAHHFFVNIKITKVFKGRDFLSFMLFY